MQHYTQYCTTTTTVTPLPEGDSFRSVSWLTTSFNATSQPPDYLLKSTDSQFFASQQPGTTTTTKKTTDGDKTKKKKEMETNAEGTKKKNEREKRNRREHAYGQEPREVETSLNMIKAGTDGS